MSEPTTVPAAPSRRLTGDAAVDAALQGLDDVADLSLSDQHERLSRVHELLHAELIRDADTGAGPET